MTAIVLPAMSDPQAQAWHALIELGERFPSGWTIVGGQLIYLHCAERGASPSRPTDDGDAALDVRARPHMLLEFTTALLEMGFTSDAPSQFGMQHRWTRADAVIDVLIPRHLGARAASRLGAAGGRTIAAPGAQGALDRSEWVEVTVGSSTGPVPRPTLVGAIAAKAAALEIDDDPLWKRHVQDVAVLATLIRPRDDFAVLSSRDFQRVRNVIGRAAVDRSIVASIDGAESGLARLTLALDTAESRPRPN